MIIKKERRTNKMKCFYCKGDMEQAKTTHFVELNNTIVIIKNVPCYKCTQCGEVVYTGSVTARLETITDKLSGIMTEIAVVNYSDSVA